MQVFLVSVFFSYYCAVGQPSSIFHDVRNAGYCGDSHDDGSNDPAQQLMGSTQDVRSIVILERIISVGIVIYCRDLHKE